MCGIAALFSPGSTPTILNCIEKMTALVDHRGPDDEGFVSFNDLFPKGQVLSGKATPSNILKDPFAYIPKTPISKVIGSDCFAAMGHRRLSILDLSSAGHQPMCTKDQRYWITYNGEVYNYIEIRRDLIKKGYEFQSNTDTEVILSAFQEWGKKALNYFNGMFSFVIFDSFEKTFFAARDRFGVKPLYYWVSPEGILAFGSEIKQFTTLVGWNPVMNGARVYDFLNWGILDHTSETMFQNVFQVRGGEYLEGSLKEYFERLNPKKWYELPKESFQGSFEDATKQYSYLIEDSIKLRLRSDVDIGSCLSGGLDSSSIVCLVNDFLKDTGDEKRQKTFSACSLIKKYDEKHFIDIVLKKTEAKAHFIYPSVEDLFEEAEKLIWHQDEPFGSTSIYAQWNVFKLVKQNNVKVMLDGQGADEQLAGYQTFFGPHFYELFKSLKWLKLLKEMKASCQINPSAKPVQWLINQMLSEKIRQPILKALGKSSVKPDWLNIDLLKTADISPFEKYGSRTVKQLSFEQINHSSLPMLLHFEDRDSMAHSVESRTPFLDYRLVEFTLSLPTFFKIDEGWTKRILRKSMQGVLPEEIRLRKDKIGFATPEEVWLRKTEPFKFLKAIEEAVELSKGILKPDLVDKVKQVIEGKKPFNFMVWRAISFGQWMKKFCIKNP